ncbi:hypothetical protein F8M41_019534 [Gigaspora margarita]|uniref:MD-2-related lipid-recognition domain-containing protein n=1 Tax=Gigaspora margarita TaxID=4874 RepID=A0A8H4AJX4_GIGMA|nr:hypothetical protein F8M41_019534 [Gigaspora margarita]
MKNFIFAFILFALLLTVNAAPFQLNKRAISFEACSSDLDSLTVKLDPDPPVSEKIESFNVSGTLTKNDITKGQTLLLIRYGDKDKQPIDDFYSQPFNESIKAGNPFKILASDVHIPKLPDSFAIAVAVGDPTDDPSNPINLFACVGTIVGESSVKSSASTI